MVEERAGGCKAPRMNAAGDFDRIRSVRAQIIVKSGRR
jgi:hypothetical protein